MIGHHTFCKVLNSLQYIIDHTSQAGDAVEANTDPQIQSLYTQMKERFQSYKPKVVLLATTSLLPIIHTFTIECQAFRHFSDDQC